MSIPQTSSTIDMSSAIIPATVSGDGPQFNKFPNEIFLEIIKYTVMLSPDTKNSRAVDSRYFAMLNAVGPFHRMRKVSKLFASLATVAFYENNNFDFRVLNPVLDDSSPWRTSAAAALPPVHARMFVKRMQILITLEDFFFMGPPGGKIVAKGQLKVVQHPITTVNQLRTFSLGARQLLTLTNVTTGFGNLEELDLSIYTDFRYRSTETILAVMAAAKFSLAADKVQISIKTNQGFVENWHPILANLIHRQ
ncbi:hypothetical protein BKA66DRAFT_441814 [Pyrenochaeta sp. MPI-SDFR-AT-0127]|nr:hypothetical protein BKA66DRAFT_441814 [Pyrenochaeta sp. MPI-SDFR-AT-0127]